jgi:peptidoglycan hydrolase-like protein with peptidoglycan-binding domain
MPTFAPLNPAGYILGTGVKTRVQKGNRGWDVFSVQHMLMSLGHSLPAYGADGDYGSETVKAVTAFQRAQGNLYVDGWAGPATVQRGNLLLMNALTGLPKGLARGQIGKESAFISGNHSEKRAPRSWVKPTYKPDANGWYFDMGVSQMASEYHTYEKAFNPKVAIAFYGSHIRGKYVEYKEVGFITNTTRLWELAAGSWNAPAWTDQLARGKAIDPENREWIEAYIDRVCSEMVV